MKRSAHLFVSKQITRLPSVGFPDLSSDQRFLAGPANSADRYANNRIESDHARLKARRRQMRGMVGGDVRSSGSESSEVGGRLLQCGHRWILAPSRSGSQGPDREGIRE